VNKESIRVLPTVFLRFVGFEPIVTRELSPFWLRFEEAFLRSGKKRGPNVGTHASKMPPVISAKTKMELSMAQ
jgi:hypothetical protein